MGFAYLEIVMYINVCNFCTVPSVPAVAPVPTPTKGQEKISPLVKLSEEDTLRVDAVHDAQVPRRP